MFDNSTSLGAKHHFHTLPVGASLTTHFQPPAFELSTDNIILPLPATATTTQARITSWHRPHRQPLFSLESSISGTSPQSAESSTWVNGGQTNDDPDDGDAQADTVPSLGSTNESSEGQWAPSTIETLSSSSSATITISVPQTIGTLVTNTPSPVLTALAALASALEKTDGPAAVPAEAFGSASYPAVSTSVPFDTQAYVVSIAETSTITSTSRFSNVSPVSLVDASFQTFLSTIQNGALAPSSLTKVPAANSDVARTYTDIQDPADATQSIIDHLRSSSGLEASQSWSGNTLRLPTVNPDLLPSTASMGNVDLPQKTGPASISFACRCYTSNSRLHVHLLIAAGLCLHVLLLLQI